MEAQKPRERPTKEKDSPELEIDELEEEIKGLEKRVKSGLETFTGKILAYGSLSIWIILLYYLSERLFAFLLKKAIITGFPVPGIIATLIVAYTFEPTKRRIFDFLGKRL
ncbi:MAG: hypothetical protein V3V92_06420 [Candidatus Hydrothermarchaeales archaeon]